MLSILFYLRPNPRKLNPTKAAVYCQVTLSGQKATPFSTGVKTEIVTWRNKGKSTGDALTDKRLLMIETRLQALHLQFELLGQPYNVHDLARDFTKVAAPPPKPPQIKPYLEVYRLFVATKKEEISHSSWQVLCRYHTNTCKAFAALGIGNLSIADIDADVLDTLKSYLLSHFAESTALKMLVYAKAIVDYAVLKKEITHSPVKPYKIGKPADKDPVFLTVEEEALLLTKDLTTVPGFASLVGRLNRVRDMYIIMRELGIHYTDYLQLKPENFKMMDGTMIFHTQRQKTKVDIYNLVSKTVQTVIEKYGSVSNLPRMSNQKYNDYLKLLFAACGINKNGSSKIARKTFSDYHTNEQPAPDPALCAMLGLKSTKYLKHYRKVDHRALLKHFKSISNNSNQTEE